MSKIGNYSHAKLTSIIRLLLKNADITSFPPELLDQLTNPGLPEQKKTIDESTPLNPNIYLDYALRCDDNQLSLDITADGELIIPTDSTVTIIPCDPVSNVPVNLGVTSLLSGNAIDVENGDKNSPTVNVKIDDLSTVGTLDASDYVMIFDRTDSALKKVEASSIGSLGGSGSGTPQGSDTQIQYNDGGSAFGGIAQFIWNDTNLVIGDTSNNTALFFREDDSAGDNKQPRIWSTGNQALKIFANSLISKSNLA